MKAKGKGILAMFQPRHRTPINRWLLGLTCSFISENSPARFQGYAFDRACGEAGGTQFEDYNGFGLQKQRSMAMRLILEAWCDYLQRGKVKVSKHRPVCQVRRPCSYANWNAILSWEAWHEGYPLPVSASIVWLKGRSHGSQCTRRIATFKISVSLPDSNMRRNTVSF